MNRLIKISARDDIPAEYQGTPVGKLLEYHNLKLELEQYTQAELLIGMCMDNRKQLRIPENFAYILRTGGGNLRYSDFKVSYAIAIGGVGTVVLLAHNNCGMVELAAKKSRFIEGLVERAGWERERAEEHFYNYAPMFEIDNEIDFVLGEAKRLRHRYPKILIVPLYYKLEDNLLYCLCEK